MLLREPGGNFTIETDVTAAPKQYYQGAGLLLWNGSTSYVRLERGFGDVGSIIFEYRDGGKHIKVNGPHTFSPHNIRTDATRVQLQLTKGDNEVSAPLASLRVTTSGGRSARSRSSSRPTRRPA